MEKIGFPSNFFEVGIEGQKSTHNGHWRSWASDNNFPCPPLHDLIFTPSVCSDQGFWPLIGAASFDKVDKQVRFSSSATTALDEM